MESQNLSKMHEKVDPYYSKGYLMCWCTSIKVEWSRFLANYFAKLHPNSQYRLLDVGCGPSIASIISATRVCSHITMADFLQSNRDEVQLFVDSDENAFEWKHYFDFVLQFEPDNTDSGIMQRTRNAIKRVVFCDVTKPSIFPSNKEVEHEEFDFIIASLIFDVVAVNKTMFIDALANVLQYLKTGGLILIHGSIGEHIYTVGSAVFPAMTADESLILSIFEDLSLQVLQWELCQKLTTHYYAVLKKT